MSSFNSVSIFVVLELLSDLLKMRRKLFDGIVSIFVVLELLSDIASTGRC